MGKSKPKSFLALLVVSSLQLWHIVFFKFQRNSMPQTLSCGATDPKTCCLSTEAQQSPFCLGFWSCQNPQVWVSVAASLCLRVIDPVVLHLFKICATASLPTYSTTAPILQTTFIAAVQRPDLWWLRAADKLQTQKLAVKKNASISENSIKVQPGHQGQKTRDWPILWGGSLF